MIRFIVFSIAILFVLEATATNVVQLVPFGFREPPSEPTESNSVDAGCVDQAGHKRWAISLNPLKDIKTTSVDRERLLKEAKDCFEKLLTYLKKLERGNVTNELYIELNLPDDPTCFMHFVRGLHGNGHPFRFDMERKKAILTATQFTVPEVCELTICELPSNHMMQICFVMSCEHGSSCRNPYTANNITISQYPTKMKKHATENPIFDDFCGPECKYGEGGSRTTPPVKVTQVGVHPTTAIPVHAPPIAKEDPMTPSTVHLWIVLAICIVLFVVIVICTILAVIGFRKITAKMNAGMHNIIHVPIMPSKPKSKPNNTTCEGSQVRSHSTPATTSPVKIKKRKPSTESGNRAEKVTKKTKDFPKSTQSNPTSSNPAIPGSDSLPLASVHKKEQTETSKPLEESIANPFEDQERSSLTGDDSALSFSTSSRRLKLETPPPGSEEIDQTHQKISEEPLLPLPSVENLNANMEGSHPVSAEHKKASTEGSISSENKEPSKEPEEGGN